MHVSKVTIVNYYSNIANLQLRILLLKKVYEELSSIFYNGVTRGKKGRQSE